MYDYSKIAGELEGQLKEAQMQAEFLNDSIVLETETGEQIITSDDFPLSAPTISEEIKEPCESCQ